MRVLLTSVWLSLVLASQALAFDHSEFDELLKQNVHWINPYETQVDYAALKDQSVELSAYLDALARIDKREFNTWKKSEQLAFLLNAYNAYTLDLVLTQYPQIDSIKDIGGFFGSPWDERFAPLLGGERTLDEIEHKMVRSARFSEPRTHFALNCASVGCPALRDEAYTGAKLEEQLADQTKRFLSDRSRNGVSGDTLRVSPLFKWYSEDFGEDKAGGVRSYLAGYAAALGLSEPQRNKLLSGQLKLRYSDYDWSLNAKE